MVACGTNQSLMATQTQNSYPPGEFRTVASQSPAACTFLQIQQSSLFPSTIVSQANSGMYQTNMLNWAQEPDYRSANTVTSTINSLTCVQNSLDTLATSRHPSNIDLLGLLHYPENNETQFPDFSIRPTANKDVSRQMDISLIDKNPTSNSISKLPSINSLVVLNDSHNRVMSPGMLLPQLSLNNLINSHDNSSQNQNPIVTSEELGFSDSMVSVSADLNSLSCLASINSDNHNWDSLNLASPSINGSKLPASLSSWKVDTLPTQPLDALASVLNDSAIPAVTDLIFSQAVEEIHSFKCKFCPSIFISLCREEAVAHMTSIHEKELFELQKQLLETAPLPPWNTVSSLNKQPNLATDEIPQSHVESLVALNNESQANTLIGEQSSQNGEGSFMCGKCQQCFNTLPECRQHMSDTHQVKSSRIRLERSQGNLVNSDANIKKNSQKKQKTRKILSKSELDKSKSNNEVVTANNNRKRKSITSLQKLTRKRLRAYQGSYICEFKSCNVRFKMLDNLEYHCKCHISGLGIASPAFACPECAYRAENWASMAGHLWRHHSIDLELHACDQCSFRTLSLSKLENTHKRIHKEERLYMCDVCQKSFKTSKQLWGHKVSHLDSNPSYQVFQCGICDKRFNDKRILRFHLDTVHYKMKPYLCHCCGYSASCRSTLRMHLRQHTGEKPFACDSCNYRTADHNSLRRHKMRHSGEKPYKCPYCSYGCIQSTTYKAHLKSKHPGMDTGLMFSCEVCPFKTIKQDTFQTHMADHKLEESNSLMTSNLVNNGEESGGLSAADFLPSGEQQTITLVEAVQFSLAQNSELTNKCKVSNSALDNPCNSSN